MKSSQENKYQLAREDVEGYQSSTKLLQVVLLVRKRVVKGAGHTKE